MEDVIFVKLNDGRILKLEGDNAINGFVIQEIKKYEGVEAVEYVYNKISLLEPDFRVRDKIMAQFFLVPESVNVMSVNIMKLVQSRSEEWFAMVIKELKDHLTYLLFPMVPEFDRRIDHKLGFGGALMRSLAHVPMETSSYFLHDWSRVPNDLAE